MLEVRPFASADFSAYAALLSVAQPERPRSETDLRSVATTRGPDDLFGWFLVFDRWELVGAFSFDAPRSRPMPGEFVVEVTALPGHRALEKELYDRLLEAVRPLGPRVLRASVREDSHRLPFYLERGFTESDRAWDSTLDLTAYGSGPFAWAPERAASAGIEVAALSQLLCTEDFERRHYALVIELLADVPVAEPFVPWPFELWRRRVLESDRLLPDGYFFAVVGDELVGVSELWNSSRPETLQTGLTGVKRTWRRRGIAQTLKLRAAQYARAHGYRFVRTTNNAVNRPMLSINEAMGFVKEPAWIDLKLELT